MANEIKKGIITKGVGGIYSVDTARVFSEKGGEALYECKARGIFRKDNIKPLPGDNVTIEISSPTEATVTEIHERKNSLTRPLVANVDYLMILASIDEPQPNLLIVDKMTVFAVNKNIIPVVIISKCDLNMEYARQLRDIYRSCSIESFCVSSESGYALAELQAFFKEGCSYVFTGNTGVGKSSLINALEPNLSLETGEISAKLGRGKHTTRQTSLFPFLGAYIADTPGFSSLEIDRNDIIMKDMLQYCFPEFDEYLGKCQFVDCAHIFDSGCAVCEAVRHNRIPHSRHKSYIEMYNEVKDFKHWNV